MKRPRIVLVDSDVKYVNTIQLKLIEELFEKIDLEVITDSVYYQVLFSKPQIIDILIISEDMYDKRISMHQVEKIFLLTEENDNSGNDGNIVKICKYSHIKTIFSEIISKSGSLLQVHDRNESQKTRIITVTSASGGSGKTTIAMGLAASLTKIYKKVLYINCDMLQNFSYMLQNDTVITGNDFYSRMNDSRGAYYDVLKHVIRTEVFNYIPPFKASLLSLGLSGSIFLKIAKTVKNAGDYDFIIMDTDHIYNENKAELLSISDIVVVVVNQKKSSVAATNSLVNEVIGINNDKYIFVCNNFDQNVSNSILSQEATANFRIDEYIDHIDNCESLTGGELANKSGLNRIAFLIS